MKKYFCCFFQEPDGTPRVWADPTLAGSASLGPEGLFQRERDMVRVDGTTVEEGETELPVFPGHGRGADKPGNPDAAVLQRRDVDQTAGQRGAGEVVDPFP